mmetsp:Transcript_81866/g.236647  ORF Transcript_81866/g.236647 Transcript_81866/m.236647 type:complete len:287 (-) Transcript_81866:986-1846(-)
MSSVATKLTISAPDWSSAHGYFVKSRATSAWVLPYKGVPAISSMFRATTNTKFRILPKYNRHTLCRARVAGAHASIVVSNFVTTGSTPPTALTTKLGARAPICAPKLPKPKCPKTTASSWLIASRCLVLNATATQALAMSAKFSKIPIARRAKSKYRWLRVCDCSHLSRSSSAQMARNWVSKDDPQFWRSSADVKRKSHACNTIVLQRRGCNSSSNPSACTRKSNVVQRSKPDVIKRPAEPTIAPRYLMANVESRLTPSLRKRAPYNMRQGTENNGVGHISQPSRR